MADVSRGIPLANRLELLLDRLGVQAAHFCARAPQDLQGLIHSAPQRIASLTLVGANARPEALATVGRGLHWITGDGGSIGAVMAPRLASANVGEVTVLRGYDEYQWSDTIADRADEVFAAIAAFWERVSGTPAPRAITRDEEGDVAELSYTARGSGPPVVLLPLGLAAHQWDALLARLHGGFCTVVLGGAHLSPVKMLEARGASDYGRVALGILDLAGPRAGESLIEVGCGSGALLRRIARGYALGRTVGLDVNRYLLHEAEALVHRDGLAERIALREGSAEAIPFPDARFDVVFTSTVMEEVDADRMMAELARIAKPGGRVAVVVRAVDRGSWTNADLPEPLRTRIESSGGGGMDERGCADASLYRRMYEVGLTDVQGGPAWAWTRPGDGWWEQIDAQIRSRLDAEAAEAWTKSIASSVARGFPVWVARPFHCAVGTKG
ncbi:MAG TPA: class I SAM-dependent methyltransferase [Chloroflexota bacterium]|nr:class I SAM-dependent methyltransferase [Chloroflexota bacterium]